MKNIQPIEEVVEMIVIEYANRSGRDDNRPEVREAARTVLEKTLKTRDQAWEERVEGVIKDVKNERHDYAIHPWKNGIDTEKQKATANRLFDFFIIKLEKMLTPTSNTKK